MIKRMTHNYGIEERDAILRVFDSGIFVKGPEGKALEEEICRFTNATCCVTVNSGSTALMLAYACIALKSKESQLHITTTPASYIATANVAKFLNHKVQFSDIDIESYCLSPAGLLDNVNPIDILSVVHLYGNGVDLESLQTIYPNVTLVEDCAQAFGTRINGKHVGIDSFGCFSMFPTKNLSCGGDGGFILCQEEDYELLMRLRDNGRFFGMDVGLASGNFRLSEFQASIAREQLKKLPLQQNRRQEIAKLYNSAFKDLPGVAIPQTSSNVEHSWHLYCPLIFSHAKLTRDGLIDALKKEDIQSSSVYPELITDTPPFLDTSKKLRNAELFSESVISLPMHSLLTDEEVDRVIKTVVRLLS